MMTKNNLIKEYDELIAFHPGLHIEEIIQDMEVTQKEFAQRVGFSAKHISKILSGEASITEDFAENLSFMLGTSSEMWMNFQRSYEKKLKEIESRKKIDKDAEILKLLDRNFLELFDVNAKSGTWEEKVRATTEFLQIHSLELLKNFQNTVFCRGNIDYGDIKKAVNTNVWLQTARNVAKFKRTNVEKFDEEFLLSQINTIRTMTLEKPKEFMPNLEEIFKKSGIIFVKLPSIKSSGIQGAVEWLNTSQVMLAINDRRNYADTFWFSLFREIKHILQKNKKDTFISDNTKINSEANRLLETDADDFARNTLIPIEQYNSFISNKDFTERAIKSFSKEIGIDVGITIGRLQIDKYLDYTKFHNLRTKYKILV